MALGAAWTGIGDTHVYGLDEWYFTSYDAPLKRLQAAQISWQAPATATAILRHFAALQQPECR